MRDNKVRNLAEFRRWVKIRLVEEEISQRELARQMDIPHARISEATHGKQAGNKFIVPIIKNLNGDLDNFKEFLEVVYKAADETESETPAAVITLAEVVSRRDFIRSDLMEL